MPPSRPGPNLSRIATSLGVSVATVSNALSGKGRVSGQLVERIREHAAELGYVPSQAGRALRTGRSGVLGLVLPDIANPLFPKIAQAIEFAASAAGYGVLIADSRGDVATQTEAINRLVERGVDGMVIIPRRATRISAAACPVAIIDTPSTPGNTVAADHWQGGLEIAGHLAGLGHRRVLIIGNNQESNVQNDRTGGIRSGMRPGMHSETLWIDRLEQENGSGCPLGLAEKVRRGFTAFAALSDLQALRALTELQQAGINIPADVSVTGFDDLIWSPVVTPSLTTVRMDMDRIAEIAVSALVDTIKTSGIREGVLVTAKIERVAMQLIVRQSSGPAKPAQKTSEMENM
ncbi:LacI family DNA-binding transcriptional regulator [Rhizobium leguminosarum]|jgi:LacI family transcriptional regulator|uniref:LacI family DNA-binding transcriptional regulator n=1 Tax=Rhizobium TaxID=379 RepID=UPI0004136489|nr:LacI family DNA-binding transcriptional regulator [Rhizobium leguminosarum]MBY5916830.1 LacI family transcriptional regulator [Rhizobium leguminosarum]RWX33173.1 LacI family transcriptional regulator [Rhizobium leguminosarum]TAU22153.1 LacI family transcriptional regulator [Rhizobium leguminosarum]TAU42152.1 LacI family transcriptional regulator [Rhizobium leguminosarum]TBE56135.1 LacI family transcriptional regulator [Rhizobium leguminosarum]